MDTKIISLLLVGGSAIVAGIAYKLFSKKDMISILKSEYLSHNCCLTKSLALRLMIAGVKGGEKRYLKNKPQLDAARRASISFRDAYSELCLETLNTKRDYFDEEFLALLTKFEGKFSMNELQEMAGGLPPMQLSHMLYQYDQPNFEGTIPSLPLAKEIYVFYANYIIKGLKEMVIPKNINNCIDNDLYFKCNYLNSFMNDTIYEKYNHSNIEIVKFVLFKEKAFENDDDIMTLKRKIETFDKIMLFY